MRRARKTEFTRLREQAGLTLFEAAALLEVSNRTAYRYETDASAPTRLAVRTMKEAAAGRAAPSAPIAFRFIDLFAGIGGLRIGFESVGGRCVFTSEWDVWSQQTYALNFPDNHAIAGDVASIQGSRSASPNTMCFWPVFRASLFPSPVCPRKMR